MADDPQTLILEQEGRVAILRLNRPEALNALNQQVMTEVVARIEAIDRDPSVAVTVLTGAGRAFAAGADIKEMQSNGFAEMYLSDYFAGWDRFAACRKPVI